jgi:hypothetical protein
MHVQSRGAHTGVLCVHVQTSKCAAIVRNAQKVLSPIVHIGDTESEARLPGNPLPSLLTIGCTFCRAISPPVWPSSWLCCTSLRATSTTQRGLGDAHTRMMNLQAPHL